MKYTRTGVVILVLLIWQTVFANWLFPEYPHYDVLLLLMVHAGLYESWRHAVVCAIFAGVLMDNISGEPFGFYTSFYFWSIVGIRLSAIYLYILNRLLPTFLVAGLVFLEHCFSWLVWGGAETAFLSGHLFACEAEALLTSWFMLAIFRRYFREIPPVDMPVPVSRV